MRKMFIETLIHLARHDETIFLLTADLGYTVFEKFQEEFPKRFLNVGVAEQNMIGIASGLALSGKTVFVYSIIPFLTLRCLEQIRNDICYHNLNVKLIGVGAGFSYGVNGHTHYALEDISIMKSLPNISVISPADPQEVKSAIEAISSTDGPFYVRLGKSGASHIHQDHIQFKIGKGIVLKKGNDITLIASGSILENALFAANLLENKGIQIRLISMPTLKPIDSSLILRAADETQAIFTIEEHSQVGGLGSSVADVLAQAREKPIYFKKIAVPDCFFVRCGSSEFLRDKNGLSKEKIADTILASLKEGIKFYEHSRYRDILRNRESHFNPSP